MNTYRSTLVRNQDANRTRRHVTPARAPNFQPMVEVVYSLKGNVPVGSGYEVFSAMARVLGPSIREADWLAVHPVHAQELRLRVTPARIPDVLGLGGRTIGGSGWRAETGEAPHVEKLKPSASLYAWMVTIGDTEDREDFRRMLQRKLNEIGARVVRIEVGKPRSFSVLHDRVSGFAVTLRGMSDEDSMKLQCAGIGGRRRFGCGVFSSC